MATAIMQRPRIMMGVASPYQEAIERRLDAERRSIQEERKRSAVCRLCGSAVRCGVCSNCSTRM